MQPQPDPTSTKPDYLTIAQIIVSGLGLVLSLLGAFSMALFGIIGLTRASDPVSITPLFSTAWISLLAAGLAVPSLVYSVQRLSGRPARLPNIDGFRLANILILIWPLVLLLGNILSGQQQLAWLLLPPLQLLAVGIPVFWLVEIARHKLPLSSRQRGWGLVNFSVFITTPMLMLAEVLAMLVIFIFLVLWISSQPDLVNLLERLAQRVVNAPPNPEAVLEIVRPYLQNPLLIFGVLAIVAGLVPLIEELLKPLGVWALAGRQLSPAEGFVAGGLCGAAFGLVESLFYLSNPLGEGWALLAAGRAGTALLHTVTSALIGWALASAWQNGAYLRLGLTYMLAVFLHGLWNGLTILTGLGSALDTPPANLRLLTNLARIAPIGVAILGLGMFGVLWRSNYYLRRQPRLVGQTVEPSNEAQIAETPEI